MFEFPCIISIYYIENQQDATLAVFLVSNQLDASIPINIFIYFQRSTCFEPYVLIIRRDKTVSTQLLIIVTPC
jgi:hypothetical protein